MSVAMQPIYTQTVGAGGANTVTFNNIPQGYQDLKIVMSTRDSRGGIAVSDIQIGFNGQAKGTSLTGRYFYGNGASLTATSTSISGEQAFGTGAGATANTFGNAELYISNYASGSYKAMYSDSASETNATGGYQILGAGLWSNNAPITSVTFTAYSAPFSQYSTFTLYGVGATYASQAPIAPTLNSVTDQAGFLSVAFTPASNDLASSYAVTTTPASTTAYGSGSPISIPVTVGTSYTAQVASVNQMGTAASSTSGAITTSNNYASIASVALGSGWGTYTFSNLPQNYTHLQIRIMSRSAGASVVNPYLNFNLDSGNNYTFHWMAGSGTTASMGGVVSGTGMWISDAPGTSTTANYWQTSVTDVLDYSTATKYKTIRSIGGYDANGSGIVSMYSGVWNSYAPVSAISFVLSGNFLTGSTLAIYGLS